MARTALGLPELVGPSDMAEYIGITKQAMSNRIETDLFIDLCGEGLQTRNGRLYRRADFLAYFKEWQEQNPDL